MNGRSFLDRVSTLLKTLSLHVTILEERFLLHIAFLRGLPEFNRFGINSEPIAKQLRSDPGENTARTSLAYSKQNHVNTADTIFYLHIALVSSQHSSQNLDRTCSVLRQKCFPCRDKITCMGTCSQ